MSALHLIDEEPPASVWPEDVDPYLLKQAEEMNAQPLPEIKFMNPDAAPAPNPKKALLEEPIWMDADWDVDDPERFPDFVEVKDGLPMLYLAESHLVFGRGGVGKSWFSYLCLLLAIRAGKTGIVIDYESNRATVKRRLKALGMTKEEAGRFAYWKISHSLMRGMPARKMLDEFLENYSESFILLDSVAVACGAAGLDDEKNPQFNQWFAAVVEPWTMDGHTSLLIDHIGLKEIKSGSIAEPRGASSKVQRCSGAAYWFDVGTPWSKTSDGYGSFWCAKDREGNRVMGRKAVEVKVVVTGGGLSLVFELTDFKEAEKSPKGTPKRDFYNQMVTEFVRDCVKPPTQSAIKKFVLEKTGTKTSHYPEDAVKWLVEYGFITEDRVEGRQAIYYNYVQDYVA